MTEVLRATVSPAQIQGDGLIRGVASTIGNVDRMRRAFLPGAFGQKAFRVPLLAFHDEKRPIGSSLLSPEGSFLRHESQLAAIPEAETIRELIKAGGIPATSIGWLPGGYAGWRALEKAQPMLAKQSASMGVPQREDVLYFDRAEIVENSVVPIPANPMALIAVASLLPSAERGMVQEMLEMAAGSRHSASDQELIQTVHDHMTKLGATCTSTASFQWTTSNQLDPETAEVVETETEQVDSETLLTETAEGKAKYSMPDGSYPISTCADVSDAAKLAYHSKTYSFDQVRRHVMRAKNALDCPDSVLPATWDSPQAAQESEEPSVATEQATVELPDLAALEQELAKLTSAS